VFVVASQCLGGLSQLSVVGGAQTGTGVLDELYFKRG